MDTSAQAFATVKPQIPSLKARVLEQITMSGDNGRTPSELIGDLAELDYSVRPRITELRKAGLVKDSGRIRANARGNHEKVFVLGQEPKVSKEDKPLSQRELGTAILKSFEWAKTPQGSAYWSQVEDNLRALPQAAMY